MLNTMNAVTCFIVFFLIQTTFSAAAITYATVGSSGLGIQFNETGGPDSAYESAPDSSIVGGDGGVSWGSLGNGFLDLSATLVDISGPELFVYEAQSGTPEFEFRVLVSNDASAFDDSDFTDITDSYSGAYRTTNDLTSLQEYIYSFDISSFGDAVRRIRIQGTSLLDPGQDAYEGSGVELDAFAIVSSSSDVIPEIPALPLGLLAAVFVFRRCKYLRFGLRVG